MTGEPTAHDETTRIARITVPYTSADVTTGDARVPSVLRRAGLLRATTLYEHIHPLATAKYPERPLFGYAARLYVRSKLKLLDCAPHGCSCSYQVVLMSLHFPYAHLEIAGLAGEQRLGCTLYRKRWMIPRMAS